MVASPAPRRDPDHDHAALHRRGHRARSLRPGPHLLVPARSRICPARGCSPLAYYCA